MHFFYQGSLRIGVGETGRELHGQSLKRVKYLCTDEALHVLGFTAGELLREGELDTFFTKLDLGFICLVLYLVIIL